MDIENLKILPVTDMGKMIGDINNLDWMDFEKLKSDVTVGKSIPEHRNFLIIKYVLEKSRNNYLENCQCFFQSYEKNKNFWTSNENTVNFINVDRGITSHQKKLLEDLIDGKIVKITEKHLPSENKYIGKKVGTPNTWRKKRAVEIIERNWIICRYDPRYKMCESVLMNNIEEARIEYFNTKIL